MRTCCACLAKCCFGLFTCHHPETTGDLCPVQASVSVRVSVSLCVCVCLCAMSVRGVCDRERVCVSAHVGRPTCRRNTCNNAKMGTEERQQNRLRMTEGKGVLNFSVMTDDTRPSHVALRPVSV